MKCCSVQTCVCVSISFEHYGRHMDVEKTIKSEQAILLKERGHYFDTSSIAFVFVATGFLFMYILYCLCEISLFPHFHN